MGKPTIQITLVTVFLLAGCGGAESKQSTMLKGSLLPQTQGWSVSTNAVVPLDVVTNGRTLTLNTIGVLRNSDQHPKRGIMWFYREVPFHFKFGFTIKFTLKVHEVELPHKINDAGIMFFGSTIDPSGNFTGGPRSQMIFFDENAIGWGDELGMFTMDTTNTFHTYTLAIDHTGLAEVYVDGTLALKRNNWKKIARIGFGDMTNEEGINGRFSIKDIIVTSRTRIPPSRPAPRGLLTQ